MIRSRRVIRAAMSAALVLLSLDATHAQSEGAANKKVKAAAKAELKLLRADLAEGVADFDAAVDAFEEALLGDAPDVAAAAQALAAEWGSLQVQALGQILDHQTAFGETAATALGEFQEAAAATGGPYPAGFHAGHDGGIDAFRDGALKEQEKARAKMEARLVKASKLLAKKAGVQLAVQTRLPGFTTGLCVNASLEVSDSTSAGYFAFGIDLLLSLDPVDGQGDAVVVISGIGSKNDNLEVNLEGNNGLPVLSDETLAAPGVRWTVLFTGVVEGNYLVTVVNFTLGTLMHDSLGAG